MKKYFYELLKYKTSMRSQFEMSGFYFITKIFVILGQQLKS